MCMRVASGTIQGHSDLSSGVMPLFSAVTHHKLPSPNRVPTSPPNAGQTKLFLDEGVDTRPIRGFL